MRAVRDDGSGDGPGGRTDMAVGDGPGAVALGDLNAGDGNGILDIVTANRLSDDLTVLLGRPRGWASSSLNTA